MRQVDQYLPDARFGGFDLLELGGDTAWVVVQEGLVPRGYLNRRHVDDKMRCVNTGKSWVECMQEMALVTIKVRTSDLRIGSERAHKTAVSSEHNKYLAVPLAEEGSCSRRGA